MSGAIAQTLPSQIDRLKWQFGLAGPYRKYKDEWKLATVFVGANNLCAACTDGDNLPAVADPEDYAVALKAALIDLRDSIGPTFVNLVGIFDVSLVYELSRGYPYCEMLFDKMPVPICSCASSEEDNRKSKLSLFLSLNVVWIDCIESSWIQVLVLTILFIFL